MTFGIPCESELQPEQVFNLIQAFDDLMSAISADISLQLLTAQREAESYLDVVLATLNRSVSGRLTRLENTLSDVYSALNQIVTSSTANLNIQLSTTIQRIAEDLQTTPAEVIESVTTSAPIAQLQPPQRRGVIPPLVAHQAATGEQAEGGQGAGEGTIGAPLSSTVIPITVNGNTVNAQQVMAPITANQVLSAGGLLLNPAFSVYQSNEPLPLGQDGNPRILVNYDQQPDGSAVVSVGPIHVKVDLRDRANPDAGPACPINPSPIG